MNTNYKFSICLVLFCHSFYNPTDSAAEKITESNLDNVLASNEVVLINFYANWCPYSNLLMPTFDKAADEVSQIGYGPGKVIIGKVEGNRALVTKFHLTKYPTLKLFYNGLPARTEYRGGRSVEAIVEFMKKQLTDPIIIFETLKELEELKDNKRHIIAYMDNKDQPEYDVLRKVAISLKDDCVFHAGFGDASRQMHPKGQPVIVFRPDINTSVESGQKFVGKMTSFEELFNWVQYKCLPLVREITFENAEELTEEGLPFLILIHDPSDTESVKKYKEIIQKELESEKEHINFLTADGLRFEHPVHHLGKTRSDLPLIVIDDLKHMYLFPNYSDLETPGRLKQFLLDLYSGKLHREFHYGPDPVKKESNNVEVTNSTESTFKKLAPSKNRYSLLRNEL